MPNVETLKGTPRRILFALRGDGYWTALTQAEIIENAQFWDDALTAEAISASLADVVRDGLVQDETVEGEVIFWVTEAGKERY